MMTIETIKERIIQDFPGTHYVETDEGIFFSYGERDKFPFATIVSRDNEFDNTSNLNRDGFFRFNIGLKKKSFVELFAGKEHYKGIGGYLKSDIDFTVVDKIFPHPMYGFMYWVSVVNPSAETFALLQPYLSRT